MRTLILLALVSLSACATGSYPRYRMINTQNRDAAQIVLDQYHCGGSPTEGIDVRYQDYYNACMDKKGYKLELIQEQASN